MPNVNIPIWNEYVHLLVLALDWLGNVFGNAGIGIIAFTLIIKTLMLPLTVQSIRSSKAMQDLQPKIRELQKKHGSDRQRISQETMALYQQYRVNPMAGCLPIFLQIPVLTIVISVLAIGIFSAFILFDVQRIVNGGETNYITATLAIYLDVYNIFTSLLRLLGIAGGDD